MSIRLSFFSAPSFPFFHILLSPSLFPPSLTPPSFSSSIPPTLPSFFSIGYEPVIVVTCLDLIYQDAVRNGRNYEVEVRHKEDKVLHAFERLHLIRQSIYFVTNFHMGQRGGVPVWKNEDEGFEKANKQMVDLSRDLLNVADRFIDRNYSTARCSIL